MALIEREALIKAIENDCPEQATYTKKDAIECVLCMPTIDATPVRHGRWEQGDMYDCGNICSECDYDSAYTPCDMRYCPNCGARMDGGEDDG